jgi:hypothetical protein
MPLPPEDPQREAVYAFGHVLASRIHTFEPLSLEACGALANAALAARHGSPVRIHDPYAWVVNPSDKRALMCVDKDWPARASATHINLPLWARHEAFILHEVAHALLLQSAHDEGHSPLFVRLWFDLLISHLFLSKRSLLALARAHHVHVARPSALRALLPGS